MAPIELWQSYSFQIWNPNSPAGPQRRILYYLRQLQVGDRVIEVNNVPLDDKQPAEIVKLLAASERTVTFKVCMVHISTVFTV